MSVFMWVLVGVLALGALATVSLVGKRRDPVSPGLAVWSVVLNAALIVGILIDQDVL